LARLYLKKDLSIIIFHKKSNMRVKEQFCKWAKEYHSSSIIQQKGASILVSNLPKSIGNVLDLGCGSGRVYEELLKQKIEFGSFLGVDFSKDMLKLHKKDKKVTLLEGDFNDVELFSNIDREIDIIVSSSALQWARDLDILFKNMANKAREGAFFIFGSNTFKTIHNIAGVNSPIYDIDDVKKAFKHYYKPKIMQIYNFKLQFDSTLEMLRYIKKSGVSGGGFGLGVKDINKIIREYPYNYLEFETILLIGTSKERYSENKRV